VFFTGKFLSGGGATEAQLKSVNVAEVKVYPRQNQNNRAHAVTAYISLCCHGAMHAVYE
jgi:hypothetical protein